MRVIEIFAIRLAMYRFLLVVFRDNDAVYHRFRDITTFTMYVTDCDLEKSFSFDRIVEITNHARILIYDYVNISQSMHATYLRHGSKRGLKQQK